MGWVANVVIVVGMWRLGRKDRSAFLYTIVGELLWCVYGAYLGMWDLAVVCFVFAVLAARNWWLWASPEPQPDKPANEVKDGRNLQAL